MFILLIINQNRTKEQGQSASTHLPDKGAKIETTVRERERRIIRVCEEESRGDGEVIGR